MRLCLSFTLVGVFALTATVASLATVSAASLKGSTLLSGPGGKPNGVKPNTGVVPNTACSGAITTSCTVGNATIATSLDGILTVGVGTGSATPPGTLDGSGTQTISFTFPSTVDDRTGTDGWVLSASSSGLTVPTVAGHDTDSFVMSTVDIACTTSLSCTSPINATGSPITITSSSTPYATATKASGGEYGSTTVTTTGIVTLGATTIGGSTSGTITVTAAPSLT